MRQYYWPYGIKLISLERFAKKEIVWSIVLALTVVKYINQEIGTMSFHHVWKFQKLISWTYVTLYQDLYKRKK